MSRRRPAFWKNKKIEFDSEEDMKKRVCLIPETDMSKFDEDIEKLARELDKLFWAKAQYGFEDRIKACVELLRKHVWGITGYRPDALSCPGCGKYRCECPTCTGPDTEGRRQPSEPYAPFGRKEGLGLGPGYD